MEKNTSKYMAEKCLWRTYLLSLLKPADSMCVLPEYGYLAQHRIKRYAITYMILVFSDGFVWQINFCFLIHSVNKRPDTLSPDVAAEMYHLNLEWQTFLLSN